MTAATQVGEVRRGDGVSTATCICGWVHTGPRTSDVAWALWDHRAECSALPTPDEKDTPR